MHLAAPVLRIITLARLFIVGIAVHTSAATATEPVWRCAPSQGAAATYQATPCPGQGHALAMNEPPTAEDRADSTKVAEREAQLAETLRRQRVGREKNVTPAHASLSGPVRQVSAGQPVSSTARTHERVKHRTRVRQQGIFRAEVPGRPRTHSSQAQPAGASTSLP